MRPKILHLIYGFGGGGAERQLSYLAPALVDKSLDIHVACVERGYNFHRLDSSACKVQHLPKVGNHDPRLLIAIARTVAQVDPDIVHTWLPQMNILGGLAAIRHRKPFIVSERSSGEADQGDWKAMLRRWIGRYAAAVVANSGQGLKYWEFLSGKTRLVEISNGLALDEMSHFRRKRIEISQQRRLSPLLLCVGRLLELKNVRLVMEAFKSVVTRHSNVTCRFLGDGPLLVELLAEVKAAGLENKIFVEPYTEELWSWIARATVLVSMSSYEGQPNVILEAAAIGCPVVLSDIPAHRELFDENAVDYVKDMSAEACAAKLDEVLGRSNLDESTDAARNVAEALSIDVSADKFADLYSQILQSQPESGYMRGKV